MKKSSLVALLIACASVVVTGCNGQPEGAAVAGEDLDLPFDTLGEGPSLPNGASPTCLANPGVRHAIADLALDRLTIGGMAPDGTFMLPSMPAIPSECRHIVKDLVECALGDDQSVMDPYNGDVYTGKVGLAEEWDQRLLHEDERRWVSACMIQRLNYFGISVPILLEGVKPPMTIDPVLRQQYPFAESTAWGDIFMGVGDTLAWICTEEDVWSLCPKDLGEPWIDTRVCDGIQDCGIAFAGRCSDACTLVNDKYWDCSAHYGYTETVRVRLQTNTHPPVLGKCE